MEAFKIWCPTCAGMSRLTGYSDCSICNNSGLVDLPQEILDLIECDRIEQKLLENNVGYSFYIAPDREENKADEFTIMLYPKKKPNITGRGRNWVDGTTKLEVLQKAENWLDGRGAE